MKKVEAVIPKFRFDEVKEALSLHGITGVSIFEVMGFGREKSHREFFRGRKLTGDLSKMKIEIIVPDDRIELVLRVLRNIANTGKIGGGKVFVSAIEETSPNRSGNKILASLSGHTGTGNSVGEIPR